MTLGHPNPDRVYICPACEHRQDLYQRQDNSVACYHCGAAVPNARHLRTRAVEPPAVERHADD